MDYYVLDDSVIEANHLDPEETYKKLLNYENVINANKVYHIYPDKTYEKLLLEINDFLVNPNLNDWLCLNFDYESIKLLLQQAKEFDIPFIYSDTFLTFFISKCTNEVSQKLFRELGFERPLRTTNILDPHLYKRILSIIRNNIDIEKFQEYRKETLEITFLMWNKKKDLLDKYIVNWNYYCDDITPEERINLFSLDLITEYFFDDYYKNVYIDIHQILKYIKLTNNHDIPSDRLSIYEEFTKLRERSISEQQNFFWTHKDFTIVDFFHDDIRILRESSRKSLVDACTKFTPDSPLYNKDLSETYGCDIYFLDGEEFYGFVRSDAKIHKDVNTEIPTGDKIRRLSHSFTYIGTEDIQTYKHPNKILTMLYTGIDYRTIEHVYHDDSQSTPGYISDFPNELHTPKSLLKESSKYPEIFISDLEGIEPCALVCLDEPSSWDIMFSQKNHLPIVIINSMKYERKYNQEDLSVEHYIKIN